MAFSADSPILSSVIQGTPEQCSRFMLSRPAASLITDLLSWHAVYLLSATIMVILGLVP